MRVDVIMPQMGESIAEGTVLRYMKKVGEAVRRDEDILEISTDKVDATVPSPATGVLAEILVPEGKTVEVNAVLARIETEAGAVVSAAPAGPSLPAAPPSAAPPTALALDLDAERMAGRIPSREELRRVRSTPLVRRIAREHGVEIGRIEGTGISGRVTKQDILAYIASQRPAASRAEGAPQGAPSHGAPAPSAAAPPPVTFAPGEEARVEAMTNIRKIIAEHMIASRRTSAHVHTVFEVDFSAVEALRAKHRSAWEEREGVKLTYMPFVLKAAIEALKAYPVVNASIEGEKIVYHRHVHLGVAVALEWGLIVPVIRNADERSLLGLARAVQDLAARARARKLSPDEIHGSTFSVTNPGALGALYGLPIVNQPNVAILGMGGVQKRPVVINDAIAIRPMIHLVLGFDHRLIDGAVADLFMAHVKGTLERGAFTDLG